MRLVDQQQRSCFAGEAAQAIMEAGSRQTMDELVITGSVMTQAISRSAKAASRAVRSLNSITLA